MQRHTLTGPEHQPATPEEDQPPEERLPGMLDTAPKSPVENSPLAEQHPDVAHEMTYATTPSSAINEAIDNHEHVYGRSARCVDGLADRRQTDDSGTPSRAPPASNSTGDLLMSLTNCDDERYGTVYRCEDCGKVLEDDDLNFDDDGIRLCNLHYEYLLADAAAMSDEEYREIYETPFIWPEAREQSEVPDGPAGLDEDEQSEHSKLDNALLPRHGWEPDMGCPHADGRRGPVAHPDGCRHRRGADGNRSDPCRAEGRPPPENGNLT